MDYRFEKQLAETFHKLVLPLNLQFETKEEQAECLLELGNLYLKAGIESKDGNSFTKASALLNAAFVRTGKDDIKEKTTKSLVNVKNEFMNIFYEGVLPLTENQWNDTNIKNRLELEDIRAGIKKYSYDLEQCVATFDNEAENTPEMEKNLIDEAKKVSSRVQDDMVTFIKRIWEQGLKDSKSSPPCRYSLVGLGSLARQEVTPYSDLEFAILVEEQNESIQKFFKTLTYLFHLTVLDLGETPVPCLAISSLNDFKTPGGDWFYDKVTPSGFKLDAAMPWACKTPIGREETETKEALSLIKTPTEMAELLKFDNELGQAYHVASVLSRTVHIVGNQDLYDDYQQKKIDIVEKLSPEVWKKKAEENMKRDLSRPSGTKDAGLYIDAKQGFYRPASTMIESARQSLTPSYLHGSQWDVIDHFYDNQLFSEKEVFDMKLWISLAFAVRLISYNTNGGQYEKVDIVLRLKQNQNQNYKAIPLSNPNIYVKKSSIAQSCMKAITSKLCINFKIRQGSKAGSSQNDAFYICEFQSYYTLAVVYKQLSIADCGESCLREKAESLDTEIDPKLKDIDYLLENKCKCIALGEIHFKILKYLLIHTKEMDTKLSGLTLEEVLEKWQNCEDGRECIYLALGAVKMAHFSKDNVELVRRVVRGTELFIFEMTRITEWNYFLGVFQSLQFHFHYWLMASYRFLEELEKLTTSAQGIVELLEKPHRRVEIDLQHFFLYECLIDGLFQDCQRIEEAFDLCQRVLQKIEKNQNNDFAEIYFQYVIKLVKMRYSKRRFDDAEALLTKYFFGEKTVFECSDYDTIRALNLMAECCFLNDKKEKAFEHFSKALGLVMLKDIEYKRHTRGEERYSTASYFFICCMDLDNCQALRNVVDFHTELGRDEPVDKIASLEKHMFILDHSMQLMFANKGLLGIEFLNSYTPQLNQFKSYMKDELWVYHLAELCDRIRDYGCLRALQNIRLVIQVFTHAYLVSRDVCKNYVDYRMCYSFVFFALNHKRYLQHAVQLLELFVALLRQDLAQCKKAIRWVELTIDRCNKTMAKMSPEIKQITFDHIDVLMGQRTEALNV